MPPPVLKKRLKMQEFFEKVYTDLQTWFIDNNGWFDVVKVVLFAVLGIIVIKIVLGALVRSSKRNAGKKNRMSKLAYTFVINVLRVILYFIYFLMLFMLIGLDMSNIVTVVSASGLAVSLALQKVASNFASGAILVANKPFEEGDFVSCNGIDGTVVDIAIFSTRLLTPDNKIAVVPNAMLADNPVVNYSAKPTRRVDLMVSVAYGSDIDLVKKTLEGILDENGLIRHDDGYTIRLKERSESSLDFVCRFWVDKANYWSAYFDVNERIVGRFKEVGIEIPYNKLDVQITDKNK